MNADVNQIELPYDMIGLRIVVKISDFFAVDNLDFGVISAYIARKRLLVQLIALCAV